MDPENARSTPHLQHALALPAKQRLGVLRGLAVPHFNLYNRENLRSYDYRVELPSGKVIPNIGETLLPSFGLTWEF